MQLSFHIVFGIHKFKVRRVSMDQWYREMTLQHMHELLFEGKFYRFHFQFHFEIRNRYMAISIDISDEEIQLLNSNASVQDCVDYKGLPSNRFNSGRWRSAFLIMGKQLLFFEALVRLHLKLIFFFNSLDTDLHPSPLFLLG